MYVSVKWANSTEFIGLHVVKQYHHMKKLEFKDYFGVLIFILNLVIKLSIILESKIPYTNKI